VTGCAASGAKRPIDANSTVNMMTATLNAMKETNIENNVSGAADDTGESKASDWTEADADAGDARDTERDAHWISRATEVCLAAAAGDLEARILHIDVGGEMGDLLHALNHLLDMTDAFVREAAASSQYISQGKHFRRVLLAGMKGVFRQASQSINQANERMAAESNELAKAKVRRAALAGEFQATRDVVDGLSKASGEIGNVVSVISTVAGQTNLLALNAAIEAARVGELGKGFAVVAGEVKSLAQKTAGATSEIQKKVQSIQSATTAAISAIDRIWMSFKEDISDAAKVDLG